MTLVETLVALALLAILTSLAAPSFQSLFAKRAAGAAADAFVADMRFARSEALKRNTPIVLCRSTDGISCSGLNSAWKDGWLVFTDDNANSQVDASEEVLRVQQALPAVASMGHPTANSDVPSFRFRATGIASGANSLMLVTPTAASSSTLARLVCISSTGRASLTKPGSTAADCP